MSDNPQRPTWQNSINPDFLQRVTHPLLGAVMQRVSATNITGRIDRMLGRDYLGQEITQRWQSSEGLQRGALPLAYAQQLPSSAAQNMSVSATPSATSANRPIVMTRASVQRTASNPALITPDPIIKTRTIVRPITQRVVQYERQIEREQATNTANSPVSEPKTGQARQRSKRSASSISDSPTSEVSSDSNPATIQRSAQTPQPTRYTHFIYRQSSPETTPIINNVSMRDRNYSTRVNRPNIMANPTQSNRSQSASNSAQGDINSPSTTSPVDGKQSIQRTSDTVNDKSSLSNQRQAQAQASASTPLSNRPIVRAPVNAMQRRLNPLHMTLSAQHNIAAPIAANTLLPKVQRQTVTRQANQAPLVTIQRQLPMTWLARKINPDAAMRFNTTQLSDTVITRTMGQNKSVSAASPADMSLRSGTVIARTNLATNQNNPSLGQSVKSASNNPSIQRNLSLNGQVGQQQSVERPISENQAANSSYDGSPMPLADSVTIQGQVTSDSTRVPQTQTNDTSSQQAFDAPQLPFTLQRRATQNNDLAQGQVRPNNSPEQGASSGQLPLAESVNIQRQVAPNTDLAQGQVRPNNTPQQLSPSDQLPLAESGNIQRQVAQNTDLPQGQIRANNTSEQGASS
ncbi:MAG: hypothetical protein WBC91_23470, partial [Phototrophicaceae bacterium]